MSGYEHGNQETEQFPPGSQTQRIFHPDGEACSYSLFELANSLLMRVVLCNPD